MNPKYQEPYEQCLKIIEENSKTTKIYSYKRSVRLLLDYLTNNKLDLNQSTLKTWLAIMKSSNPHHTYKSLRNNSNTFFHFYCYQEFKGHFIYDECMSEYQKLKDDNKTILDNYITRNPTKLYYREIISKFLNYLESINIPLNNLSYTNILTYVCSLNKASKQTNSRTRNAITSFLKELGAIDICNPYIYLALDNFRLGKTIVLDNCSSIIQEMFRIENDFQTLSIKEFSDYISIYMQQIIAYEYKDFVKTSHSKTLYDFLLFLSVNNLDYHPKIFENWINLLDEAPTLKPTRFKVWYNLISLIETGYCNPEKVNITYNTPSVTFR